MIRIKKLFFFPVMIAAILLTACDSQSDTASNLQYVDPFIGTDFFAHTYPGPGLPFGMVHLSPDVYTQGWTYASGYQYADNSIMGFSHTHYSGVGMTGKGDILAELTVTRRAGMHKYTFPESDCSHTLIDLGHSIGSSSTKKSRIKFVNNNTIEGFNISKETKVFFVAEFSKDFAAYGTWDGNFNTPESNAWQYIWSVQHDVGGLIRLFGGNKKFTSKLDSLFAMSPDISDPKYVGVVGTIGQYVHGNQPSHHVAYLYNYAGMPWKTQEKVHRVMDLYRTGQGGICGNEDMGSLSSWYVLSAMGFYPVSPGQNVYVIGTPLFEEVIISLNSHNNDGQFIVKANNISSNNKYIQSATLNGKSMNKSWISHGEIINGGTLIFEMGDMPNKEWGSGPADLPPSVKSQ